MAYTISKKAQDNLNIFFNEYCKNCKGLTNINDVINKAVKLSYRASVLRALYDGDKLVGFNGMTSQKNNARSAGENILQNFLSATHSNGNNFQVVKDTWDAIRENYHNQGITWYTYGNAQKWVSMAIKYFVVIGYKNKLIDFDHPLADCVFPVDGIMINEIFKDFRIKGVTPSWSKCDDKTAFIKYIQNVKSKIIAKNKKVLEYEIEKWIP